MNIIYSVNSWKEFLSELNLLGSDSDYKKEKGNLFEELCRLYLQSNPIFSSKIEKIWHHSKIPQNIIDAIGIPQPEIGVDLLAKVKNGKYWAIQCKFHQNLNKNVSLEEVSTFFAITNRKKMYDNLSHRIIATSAFGVSKKISDSFKDKLGYITYADFYGLNKDDFDGFRRILDGNKSSYKPLLPRPHQKRVIEKSYDYFISNSNKRGKFIHPCGSGKSLSSYWIAKKLESRSIIIVVPSLALVRQTLDVWLKETLHNKETIDWLAVCSDETVKNIDDPSMNLQDIGIEVNTRVDSIKEFLSIKNSFKKILITTYQSSRVVSEATKEINFKFDLGLFDEAHKTVGLANKLFAYLLYDQNILINKRIFMTATERQFIGNTDKYISMNDHSVYGDLIDEFSFKSAIEQSPKILSDYKIVSIVITKSEIKELILNNNFVNVDGENFSIDTDTSSLVALVALRKVIEKKNLNHVISFHSSIKRAKNFQNINNQLNKVNKNFLHSYHVSGKDGTGKRQAELNKFLENKPSLITNARCLTEGVDIPAIDAVLFADPKQSKVDIVQAAGRALRVSKDKEYGYIIVPIFIDDEEESKVSSAFNQIISVIGALGVHDKRIIDECSEISKGNSSNVEKPIIEIEFPEQNSLLFRDFSDQIAIKIWNRLNFGWIENVEKLKKYIDINNNSYIAEQWRDNDGFKLGKWVHNYRNYYREGILSEEKIKILEGIKHWKWKSDDARFDKLFLSYKDYINKNKYTFIPANYYDKTLKSFIQYNRKKYQEGQLDKEKINLFESINGWTWSNKEEQFSYVIESFKNYYVKYGNYNVPFFFKDDNNFPLGQYYSKLKESDLSEKNRNKLLALDNFTFKEKNKFIKSFLEPFNDNDFKIEFEKAFISIKKYLNKNKNLLVEPTFKDDEGVALGIAIKKLQSAYKNNRLKKDAIKKLESLDGWYWSSADIIFYAKFNNFLNYVKKHNTTFVPQNYIDDLKLCRFLENCRESYKKNTLELEKVKLFNNIAGWHWELEKARFEYGLSALKHFYKTYGNYNIQYHYKNEIKFNLGVWYKKLRIAYKYEKLSLDERKKIELLENWKSY